MSTNGVLELVESRHPLLERFGGGDSNTVSNDVRMERGKSQFAIITGLNMGGKSTYLKQVATIVIMAHVGCPVPCQSATIPLFDLVLCRVGAGDQ